MLGGDHTIALPDVTGVARHVGWGKVSVVHFDAHADTADHQFGVADRPRYPDAPVDRVRRGARRPLPPDRPARLLARPRATLAWMAEQGMRSYEMTEVVARGLDACLTEAFAIATDQCDARLPLGRRRRGRPEVRPRRPALPSRAASSPRASCSTRCAASAMELPVAGVDVVELSPPFDHADVTAYLGNRIVLEVLSGIAWRQARMAGRSVGHREIRCSER